MTTIDRGRRPTVFWTPIFTTHLCERHMLVADGIHCGKRARWRHVDGRIACGGCRKRVDVRPAA